MCLTFISSVKPIHNAKIDSSSKKSYGPALIDDAPLTPPHAIFNWMTLSKVIVMSLLLWAGAIAHLCKNCGWHGALTQVVWFFTKAALMTFGGTYVIPVIITCGITGLVINLIGEVDLFWSNI